jgi:hypothetical protein
MGDYKYRKLQRFKLLLKKRKLASKLDFLS